MQIKKEQDCYAVIPIDHFGMQELTYLPYRIFGDLDSAKRVAVDMLESNKYSQVMTIQIKPVEVLKRGLFSENLNSIF